MVVRIREWLLFAAGWLIASIAVGAFAARSRDWFDMTDELGYERLAESIARTHSFVPRIHGRLVESWALLYPTLIAPAFHHATAVHDVRAAHLLNAVIMSSVVVPVYLLARRVVGSRPLAAGVAAFSVLMPWIVYAGMLMTEVAAYPRIQLGRERVSRST
ncbi:MAG TPA: hypothetical protein VGQ38_14950 [Gaiellaceae bacterium]|jgi:hypothetical protein|nr:hypothetical protein [Gaiellaceae bacterium]